MDLLQYLIVPGQASNTLSLAPDASSTSVTAPLLAPTSAASPTSESQKICFFYYHMGECRRDPSRTLIAAGEKACPYAHTVPVSAVPGTVEIQMMRPKYHKRACGLPLCAWKDGVPSGQEKGRGELGGTGPATPANVGRKRRRSEGNAVKMEKEVAEQLVSVLESNKKRKGWMHHPDRPSFLATKRTKISYDDLYTQEPSSPPSPPLSPMRFTASAPLRDVNQAAEKLSETSAKTCFFWYHGHCKRSRDRGGCNMKHALSDPPAMVEPPPGYVHRQYCELEWCPGDHVEKPKEPRKSKKESTKRYFDGRVGGEGDTDADEDEASQSEWFLEGFEEDN